MSNKRIYEVAADYGKPVNEVLDLLKKNNLDKKNFSGADEQVMAVIRKAYDKKPEPPKAAPKPEKKQEQPRQGQAVKEKRLERALEKPISDAVTQQMLEDLEHGQQ